jgi:hypothetical protein
VSVEGVSPFLFLLQPSLLSTKHGVFAYFLSIYIYICLCTVEFEHCGVRILELSVDVL